MAICPSQGLEKKCSAWLIPVTLARGQPGYGTSNQISIYDKETHFPNEDIFHHIHSFFDTIFNRELDKPVEILKGFELDLG